MWGSGPYSVMLLMFEDKDKDKDLWSEAKYLEVRGQGLVNCHF